MIQIKKPKGKLSDEILSERRFILMIFKNQGKEI